MPLKAGKCNDLRLIQLSELSSLWFWHTKSIVNVDNMILINVIMTKPLLTH